MITFGDKKIYLACGQTDMRKSINGLAAIVEGSFKLDLYGVSLFVFCNRSRDRLKILEWDGDGFWLYFKNAYLHNGYNYFFQNPVFTL